MDIAVPLTLEAVRLVMQMCPEKFDSTSTPEYLYDLFYKEVSHTHIYIYSSGDYYFIDESALNDRQYVPVTLEEAREMLFINSLEN